MPTFTADQLRRISRDIFQAVGSPKDEAETLTDFLVLANLMGHDSHGVIRIPQYVTEVQEGNAFPGAKIEVVRELGSTAILSGNWGFGHVIAKAAMEKAMEMAEKSGIASVGIINSNHIGRIGAYPEIAAKSDMIGFVCANSHGEGQTTAPWGGKERRLSTNPISFAIPTGSGNPIVLDMTTSVVAEGKIRVYRNRGHELPKGWIIDSEGNATIDPNSFYDGGALLSFGGVVGYKGFGLGLIVDILSGALTGAGCTGVGGIGRTGNATFLIAIRIENFIPIDEFKEQVDALRDHVKSAEREAGVDEILVPGEPEFRTQEKRLREGIFIEDRTWGMISEAASSLGLDTESV